MSDHGFDPNRFFDSFPRFIESSETGPWLERLNARYAALIHANRALLDGARVLDLGSHDGRFTFAALKNGADHVVGVDNKAHLAQLGRENLAAYGVSGDAYEFLVGDVYDCIDESDRFDVVFCFGLLYHVTDHMQLLSKIAGTEPRAIIVDTHVSMMEGTVIELRSPTRPGPPLPGSHLEGRPTAAALSAMLSSFGWTFEYFDWRASGLTDRPKMTDYERGSRLSVVASCPEHAVPPEVRRAAVGMVLDRQRSRETQFVTISLVASDAGISPQALRRWVHQEERARWRNGGSG